MIRAGDGGQKGKWMNSVRTDNEYEKQHIETTLEIVEQNCKEYRESAEKLMKDIQELDADYKENSKKNFKSGDASTWLAISNSIALYESTLESLARNERARNKPYFGRILLTENGKQESFYIGRGSINRNLTEQVVIDWRAPISNVYYESGLGECEFKAPDGKKIKVELDLKRTYDISGGKLDGYFDSEAAANDELLNKYLARNKQAVLGEIIATIQKEQNDIIRKTPLHNVLVQGVAGSGKTTVAMHRISYILYNYADTIKPSDFYIIGSNRMLLNYITGVLPELDVNGFLQMTMEQLFVRLLYTDWDKSRHFIRELDPLDETASLRGGTKWFERLQRFVDRYELRFFEKRMKELSREEYRDFGGFRSEQSSLSRNLKDKDEERGLQSAKAASFEESYIFENLYLNPHCFCEGIENGIAGVYDRSATVKAKEWECVKLISGGKLSSFLDENRDVSFAYKTATLNEWIRDNLERELLRNGVKYATKETAEIRKCFSDFFRVRGKGPTEFELYDDFLRAEGCEANIERSREGKYGRYYDVYDLAALAYIYKRLIETDEIIEARHIVVDEAQDYGMMAYRVMNFCVKDCRYTIMGDVSQNIRYESGINDWKELEELMLGDEGDSFCTLRKSYRNTIEISAFATGILEHGSFEIYPVEPIIRHGKEPEIRKATPDSMYDEAAEICREWQKNGLETIAVVCRNREEADEATRKLSERIELLANDPDEARFGNGVMVLPVSMTKGLEFDAVLILDPTREKYPTDNTNVKLLYVAATRALHELCILEVGDLTGLICDDISEERKRELEGYRRKQEALEQKKAELERLAKVDTSFSAEADEEWVKRKILLETAKSGNVHELVKKPAAEKSREISVQNRNNLKEAGSEDRDFAKEIPDAALAVPGHAIINQSVKWVMKQKDGVYFQSRYGILRVCPIAKNLVRVTFCQGTVFTEPKENVTAKFAPLGNYTVREQKNTTDIILPELIVSVDRTNGCITYKNSSGKTLLKERKTEARYIAETENRNYTYFDVNSSESFHVYDTESENLKYLHNVAYCVTPKEGVPPFVIRKDSFGLVLATGEKACFCQRPAIGTFAMMRGKTADMYFCAAPATDTLLNVYKRLVPKLKG